MPEPTAVKAIVEAHLHSFPKQDRFVEVAFFGGNFTGLPEAVQDAYLDVVKPYLVSGQVQGLRCSTRPDYIDANRLKVLKQKGMYNIELGAQSTDDTVLQTSGRGHDAAILREASRLIIEEGFELGLQMMIGLPGSTPEKDMQTAHDIVAMGAKETRIYPCLVVKDTVLEQRYRKGTYQPLLMEEAIRQSADLYMYFASHGVKVLRIGLHASDDLDRGDCVAGPYHHNFAEMVYSEVWRRKLADISGNGDLLTIFTHPSQRTNAIGYRTSNRKELLKRFHEVRFVADDTLALDEFRFEIQPLASRQPMIIASALMPDIAKRKLEKLGQVLWLNPVDFVYPSIAAHPDVFFFQYADNQFVFAPNTPSEWIAALHQAGVKLMRGKKRLGGAHPETVFYNAVGTKEMLIHNLKYTDERILLLYDEKHRIHVNQAYTRCNLIAINAKAFITSDEGIFCTLEDLGFDMLFIDPHQIRLEGHDYGFFPGCCGYYDGRLFVCGSTANLKEKKDLDAFLKRYSVTLEELYDGPLTDLGGIFFS